MEELETYEVDGFVEPVSLQSDEDAAWAMRRLKTLVDNQLTNQAVADREIARLEAWLEDVNGKLEYRANYFRDLLMDYMRRQREQNRKSVNLPYGTIKSRVNPDKAELDDEFVQWASIQRPDLLSTPPAPSPKPNLNKVKELLKAGEVLPHAKLIEGGVSFSIEVK